MPKKTPPKEERIIKGRRWVSQYAGQHLIKGYRHHFGVDKMTAIRDLYEIGAIDQNCFEILLKQETERLVVLQRRKEETEVTEWKRQHEHQNDQFYFIAGYTPGGAPYGVTWEEIGLKPWEELE